MDQKQTFEFPSTCYVCTTNETCIEEAETAYQVIIPISL